MVESEFLLKNIKIDKEVNLQRSQILSICNIHKKKYFYPAIQYITSQQKGID